MPLLIPIQKNVIKVEIVCHFREIAKFQVQISQSVKTL